MGDHVEECPRLTAPLGAVRTSRLSLSPIELADTDAFAVIFAEKAMWRFPYGRGLTAEETARFVEAQRADWDRYGVGLWAVRPTATDKLVGYVGLSIPRF